MCPVRLHVYKADDQETNLDQRQEGVLGPGDNAFVSCGPHEDVCIASRCKIYTVDRERQSSHSAYAIRICECRNLCPVLAGNGDYV